MERLLERIDKLALPARLGLAAGVAVLITVGFYFALIQPVQDEIQSLNAQVAADERTLAEKQAIADNLNERRKEMQLLEQRLQEALTQLPEKKDMEELVAQLNDVGRKAGVDIVKVVPAKESSRSFYAEIPIAVAVNGNYHEVAMFLQEIANLRRIVNVSQLKMGTPTINGDRVSVATEFTATTFRFSEPGQAKGPAKPGTPGGVAKP